MNWAISHAISAVKSDTPHLDLQALLGPLGDTTGLLQKNPQLSIGVSRSDMGHDLAATLILADDLHRDRARSGPHFPDVRHRPNLPA